MSNQDIDESYEDRPQAPAVRHYKPASMPMRAFVSWGASLSLKVLVIKLIAELLKWNGQFRPDVRFYTIIGLMVFFVVVRIFAGSHGSVYGSKRNMTPIQIVLVVAWMLSLCFYDMTLR